MFFAIIALELYFHRCCGCCCCSPYVLFVSNVLLLWRFSGYVFAAAVIIAGLFFLILYYFHDVAVKLQFYGIWLCGIYSSVNDYIFASQIVKYILEDYINCASIQTRAFFLAFMPWGDVGRYFSLPPYTDNGVNIMMPIPPPDQQFKNFITTEFVPTTYLTNAFCYMTTFSKQSTDNVKAFDRLCNSFSQCSVPPTDPYSCVNDYSSNLQDPKFKSFLAGLFLLLACKSFLDVSKLVIIIASIWRKKIIYHKWTTEYIKNSPFSPLLQCAGIDFYHKGVVCFSFKCRNASSHRYFLVILLFSSVSSCFPLFFLFFFLFLFFSLSLTPHRHTAARRRSCQGPWWQGRTCPSTGPPRPSRCAPTSRRPS